MATDSALHVHVLVDHRSPHPRRVAQGPRAVRLCACGAIVQTRRHKRCAGCVGMHSREDTLCDPSSRFLDDPWAVEIASRGGCTLEIVGEVLGITRERVRQIEYAACKHLHARLLLVGVTPEDVREMLASRPDSQNSHGFAGYVKTTGERMRESFGPLPVAPWSEHGLRVEAALVEAERAADRATLASVL